jgi:hypothetical protein
VGCAGGEVEEREREGNHNWRSKLGIGEERLHCNVEEAIDEDNTSLTHREAQGATTHCVKKK